MSSKRSATDRARFDPPLGRMPALQFVLATELLVDLAYQRSIETGESQSLIQRIAKAWNWDLCQPLVVARRQPTGDTPGGLYVIDGQHRLMAARLRQDISQLPAVVLDLAGVAQEAAHFVSLNQQRRPLNGLQIFKAALASGDAEAVAIAAALTETGLSLATSTNPDIWKPGQVANVGGILAAWRKHGPAIVTEALHVLAAGFAGEKLAYAGTIFPGLVAVVVDEFRDGHMPPARFALFTALLTRVGQRQWRQKILAAKVDRPGFGNADISAWTLRQAWAADRAPKAVEPPSRLPPPTTKQEHPRSAPAAAKTTPTVNLATFGTDGRSWCEQCEERVSVSRAGACRSAFCKLKAVA